jgi:RNA polymerase sigma-70 factor, ECF subfamily
MTSSRSVEITRLLKRWNGGDRAAFDSLVPLVHGELKRMARHYMLRERAGNSLQTTALVNEAYIRLVEAEGVDWQDRAHFFAVSGQMMRRILVDAARMRIADKRGGVAVRVNLDEIPEIGTHRASELIALDDALNALGEVDPRKVTVIEMRFFGGLSVEEASAVLKISPQSVMRDWKLAKAWLQRELRNRDC